MKPACPTQFLACLLYNHPVGFVFTACLYVFLACPAEMLPTLGLKTGILLILVSVASLAGVESWYLTRTGWKVFQDKTVTVKDKTGLFCYHIRTLKLLIFCFIQNMSSWY